MHWQLQEAKNRFSEVVREGQTSGPQVITVRGREAAVVTGGPQFRRGPAGRLRPRSSSKRP
ncbi:MAG: type II toxin-antitoxin system prevent-host-death family antitoxin [Deltaproteobacteria bacterium]|nr:type II toxin-antitoxin system prevent-host-death family antitoxin [Deltaproteobacteria bacterium]